MNCPTCGEGLRHGVKRKGHAFCDTCAQFRNLLYVHGYWDGYEKGRDSGKNARKPTIKRRKPGETVEKTVVAVNLG